jgi:serine/threonine-protein kinase
MVVAACPASDTLSAFARGELPPDELSAVAGHVGACAACCAALKAVPEDSLVALARAAAASPSIAPREPGQTQSGSSSVPAALANHPRYRVVGVLGAGGMGTVYKAEDHLMGRTIALKVVSPHLTAKASAVERFHREVRAAAQLEYDNIVRAYDAGEVGGSHFLVMEFVEGVSLDRLVAKKGPLAVPTACQFTRQAALGLQYAADKGMVHRDIKPQNLMVTRKGRVKILDFGLARFASTGEEDAPRQSGKLPFGAGKAVAAGLTNPNLLMGTPDYLSPEQAKDSHNVDARSDVYSLGCTLYFLLTGRVPFPKADTLIDKLLAHTQEEPEAVRSLRPEVPDALAEVLAKMMAKRPEDRYQSASEAAAALSPFTRADAAKEAAGFEVIDAVVIAPAAPPALSPEPVAPLALDTASAQESRTLADAPRPKKKSKKKAGWWKRRRVPVLAGLAAALLVAAIAIAAGGKKNDGNPAIDPDAGSKADTQRDANIDKGDAKSVKKNTVIGPGKTVLYVLPSEGVWLGDYQPVRERLEKKGGATVVTASGTGGEAKVHWPRATDPKSVPIDVKLADAVPGDYDGVVFCGYKWEEYAGDPAAGNMIRQMLKANKPVGAICVGQGVLASHDVLRGRAAARCQRLVNSHPDLFYPRKGITLKNERVWVDGKIVTAAAPEDEEKFAEALLKVLGEK